MTSSITSLRVTSMRWENLLHRERLLRMANFRLDCRLSGRVDADDILQETYIDAAHRLHHYIEDPQNHFSYG